jgi:hypothetical protein
MDAHFRSFRKEVLAILVRKKIRGQDEVHEDEHILKSKTVTAVEYLQCALSRQPGGDYRDRQRDDSGSLV